MTYIIFILIILAVLEYRYEPRIGWNSEIKRLILWYTNFQGTRTFIQL